MSREDPTIICLCGSTRFKKLFEIANWRLSCRGVIVLTVGGFPHADTRLDMGELEDNGTKELLDRLHKRKIDLADAILVLDKKGYIGESTSSEIHYAQETGTPVEYWSEYRRWEQIILRIEDTIDA